MSTKHLRNANDLVRFKCALQIVCGHCQNTATLAAWDAARVFGREDIELVNHRFEVLPMRSEGRSDDCASATPDAKVGPSDSQLQRKVRPASMGTCAGTENWRVSQTEYRCS